MKIRLRNLLRKKKIATTISVLLVVFLSATFVLAKQESLKTFADQVMQQVQGNSFKAVIHIFSGIDTYGNIANATLTVTGTPASDSAYSKTVVSDANGLATFFFNKQGTYLLSVKDSSGKDLLTNSAFLVFDQQKTYDYLLTEPISKNLTYFSFVDETGAKIDAVKSEIFDVNSSKIFADRYSKANSLSPTGTGEKYDLLYEKLAVGRYKFAFNKSGYTPVNDYVLDLNNYDRTDYYKIVLPKIYAKITQFNLNGQVISDAGYAINGATVKLTPMVGSNGKSYQTTTRNGTIPNKDNNYQIQNIDNAQYNIDISAANYVTLTSTIFTSEIIQEVLTRNWVLNSITEKSSKVKISGKVVNQDYAPLANRQVILQRQVAQSNNYESTPSWSTQTDNSGNFTFSYDNSVWGNPKYSNSVRLQAIELNSSNIISYYPSASGAIQVSASSQTSDIVIKLNEKASGFYGSVLGPGSAAIPLAKIEFYDSINPDQVLKTVTADKDGKYDASWFTSSVENYRIVCTPPQSLEEQMNYISLQAQSQVGQKTRLDFTLAANDHGQDGGRIQGRVVNSSYNAVSGAVLELSQKSDDTYLPIATVKSGSDGFYTINLSGDIFLNLDPALPLPKTLDLQLTASTISPLLSKVEKFSIKCNRGFLYQINLVLGDNLVDPGNRNMQISVFKEIRKFNDPKQIVSRLPAANIPIKVVLNATGKPSGGSSKFSVTSGSVLTNSVGVANFPNLPKYSGNAILVLSGADLNYTMDTVTRDGVVFQQTEFNSSQTSLQIILWSYDFALNNVTEALDKFYFNQKDPRWGNMPIAEFGESGGYFKNAGCCTTAFSMALNYVLPGKNITPRTVVEAFHSSKYGNIRLTDWYSPNMRQFVTDMSGGQYSMIRNDSFSWDDIRKLINQGIPVVAYSSGGIPRKNDDSSQHHNHCVLITKVTSTSVSYLDPGPGADSYQTHSLTRMSQAGFKWFLYLKPKTQPKFTSDSQEIRQANLLVPEKALAAETKVTIGSGDSFTVSTRVTSPFSVPFSGVFLEKYDSSGNLINTYEMTKTGDKWNVTIPGYETYDSFSYDFLAVNPFMLSYRSETQKVAVDTVHRTSTKIIANDIQKTSDTIKNTISSVVASVNFSTPIQTVKKIILSLNTSISALIDSLYGKRFVVGDTNQNGVIEVSDSIKVLRIVVGLDPKPLNICPYDVNGNGSIDSGDATAIQRIIVNMDPSPTKTCIVKLPYTKGNLQVKVVDQKGEAVSDVIIKVGPYISYLEPNATSANILSIPANQDLSLEIIDRATNKSFATTSPTSTKINLKSNENRGITVTIKR